MYKYVFLPVVILFSATVAQADIIGWECGPDADGNIALKSDASWDEANAVYTLGLVSTQYASPAHMVGDFTTDTPLDPTIWIRNTVENDGTLPPLSWTGYIINMSMTKTFTIDDAATNPDWTVASITQPTQVGSNWIGQVVYAMKPDGSPINAGQSGEFDLKISFLGSISFCQEQIATPEPASLLLLGIGGLFLARRRG